MGTWIDFRTLREQLDFGRVLAHYGISLKRRGSQAVAKCPLPKHPKESTTLSLSVNLPKRVFQCFACGAKGNVLDFIAYMENLDPRNSREFRQAAIIAQERFVGTPASKPPNAVQPAEPKVPSPSPSDLPVLVNEPLDFALKNLDTQPSYLLLRGFTQETINHFGLGYCTKGTFAGRIVIPLHDLEGRLIGYAGRLIFDDAIDAKNPKYLYPPQRQREGKILAFDKSLLVYHGQDMSEKPVHDLVVVQSFPSTWWLWQQGYKDVVALMGATCSTDQAQSILTLTSRSARIWCFTDAGKAGEKCAQSLFAEIGPYRFCKWVRPESGQPTNCDGAMLAKLLEWKIDK